MRDYEKVIAEEDIQYYPSDNTPLNSIYTKKAREANKEIQSQNEDQMYVI